MSRLVMVTYLEQEDLPVEVEVRDVVDFSFENGLYTLIDSEGFPKFQVSLDAFLAAKWGKAPTLTEGKRVEEVPEDLLTGLEQGTTVEDIKARTPNPYEGLGNIFKTFFDTPAVTRHNTTKQGEENG
jgi:hypothetical protein